MKRLHARQGSPPTRVPGQVDRVPRLGGIAFYQVNGSCQAIPACRDKINHDQVICDVIARAWGKKF